MSAPLDLVRRRITRAEGHAEWLAQRAPYVGASSAAALFGEHRHLTLGQLAHEKLTGATQADNAAMRRGRMLEGAVAEWWANENHVDVIDAPELFIVNEVLIATLDRLIVQHPNEALEVKTINTRVTDIIDAPRSWWWQAQTQLACTGFDVINFAVLDASLSLRSFTVEPDHDAITTLVEGARVFLDAVEHARATGEVVIEQAEFTPPDAVELGPTVGMYVRAARVLAKRIDIDTADMQRLKALIKHALGASDVGTIDGREVAVVRHRKGAVTIDAKALRREHPDIAAAYSREGLPSSWLVIK